MQAVKTKINEETISEDIEADLRIESTQDQSRDPISKPLIKVSSIEGLLDL